MAEPWADTGTSIGRLMLTVLGGLADVERDLIRSRTAEGRSRAKAHGQQMGRPPTLHTRAQQKRPSDARAEGAIEYSAPQIADRRAPTSGNFSACSTASLPVTS